MADYFGKLTTLNGYLHNSRLKSPFFQCTFILVIFPWTHEKKNWTIVANLSQSCMVCMVLWALTNIWNHICDRSRVMHMKKKNVDNICTLYIDIYIFIIILCILHRLLSLFLFSLRLCCVVHGDTRVNTRRSLWLV